MLGGLDWTQTFLGAWFRTQNQVLFFFAAIIFVVSVALHLFSIEEEQYSPQQERAGEAADALPPTARGNVLDGGVTLFPEEVQSEHELTLDCLSVDMVRSKSDSVLHVPDAALDLEPELPFLPDIEPSIFHDGSYPGTPRSTSQELTRARPPRLASLLRETAKEDETLLDNHLNEAKVPNGSGSPPKDGPVGYTRVDVKPSAASGSMRRRRHMFRRQASSTFSYYGKIGSHRYRYRRANAVVLIKPSRSMSDLYELQKRQRQRCRHRNQSGATTSSGDTESEEGEGETSVRLLWLSMLKMPKELTRLCLCHLLTWFSVIAEAVFYTDFMGQVIFEGDPKVRARGRVAAATAWHAASEALLLRPRPGPGGCRGRAHGGQVAGVCPCCYGWRATESSWERQELHEAGAEPWGGGSLLQRPTAVHQPAPELSGSRTDLLCPVAQLGWDLLLPVPSAGLHLWLHCTTPGHVASAQALASLPSSSGAGQGRGWEGLKPLAPRSGHTVAESPVSVAFLTVYKINSLPASEM